MDLRSAFFNDYEKNKAGTIASTPKPEEQKMDSSVPPAENKKTSSVFSCLASLFKSGEIPNIEPKAPSANFCGNAMQNNVQGPNDIYKYRKM